MTAPSPSRTPRRLPRRTSSLPALLLAAAVATSVPWLRAQDDSGETGTELGALPETVVQPTPAAPASPLRINDRVPAPPRIESSAATYDVIVEPGKDQDLLEIAASASMGQASHEELMARPFLRHGELLEVIPGMIVTQHSGTGKSNQYFVRGFNLDHGTDFGVFVDSMPVNKRTHGHGQGYTDLNFIIPELVDRVDYTKGPYFSDLGDFTSAGSARFRLWDVIPHGQASVGVGQDGYFRFMAMDSFATEGGGYLSAAVEYNEYDGPWVLPENTERINAFLRYFRESGPNRYSLTGMLYHGRWNATDQIPQRLVDSGRLDRLGFIDPTLGGDSHRYSLSFNWIHDSGHSITETDLYVGRYELDLFSNFTYFLDDPVNGDQFNQRDQRTFAGAAVRNTRENEIGGRAGNFTFGFQTHHDWIDEVGLYNTAARQRIGTVRQDEVYETSLSTFANQELELNHWLRVSGGLRGDLYHFDINSDDPRNSGSDWAGIVSPKFGAVVGPWNESELYFNWGGGFHSNDVRGVTMTRDPDSGDPVDPADALVRQWGTEIGVRTRVIPKVVSSVAVWYLESDSELLFEGDTGGTEPTDATQRYGAEWAVYWTPVDWIRFDSELSVARAELRDKSAGNYLENSVPVAHSAGITLGYQTGLYTTLRSRYFSPRPLDEFKSVVSRDSLSFNLRTGYRRDNWELYVDVLNLFDTDANDIEYLYESRLPGEPAGGVEDVHFHPLEPRTVRAGFTVKW